MTLQPGIALGPYEVVSLIGAGGMGEVYLARDTQLGRNVALKVLPDMFAADTERVARLRREAQVLAALHHPNIAIIHGFEDNDLDGRRIRALVLEYIEGDTLADRIARGAITFDDAVPMALEIGNALQSAHDQGIIHRDLKPSNIKITPAGSVKVLDFGLAKLAAPAEAVAGGSSSVSLSPTITSPAATILGVILGTAAYMAPEQAKGKTADKRSDVWAFGCVLFEMLTGKRAFEGDDVSDTLASVLKGEPDWTALPADVPVPVKTLLRGCLTKDPRMRVADIAAALFVLRNSESLFSPAPPAGPVIAGRRCIPIHRRRSSRNMASRWRKGRRSPTGDEPSSLSRRMPSCSLMSRITGSTFARRSARGARLAGNRGPGRGSSSRPVLFSRQPVARLFDRHAVEEDFG